MILVGLFALVGLIVLIVGIVLMTKAKSKEDCDPSVAGQGGDGTGKARRCDYSEEAKRAKVDEFLQKVQDKYYELHPQGLIFKPGGVKHEELMEKFKPYNPDPSNLKHISDTARELLDELKTLGVNSRQMKPREKKALAQVKHYLENNFEHLLMEITMLATFSWGLIYFAGSRYVMWGLQISGTAWETYTPRTSVMFDW